MDALDPEQLRAEVRQALDRGDQAGALGAARELWAAAPGPASASLVRATLPEAAPKLRVRVLRSCTVEPLVPLLRAEAAIYCVDLHVSLGPFNAWAQELLQPDSETYAADPEVIVLALTTRELSRPLWDGFAALDEGEIDAEVERVSAQLAQVVAAARSHCNAHLLLHTLDAPTHPANGVLDAQREGQRVALQRVAASLRALAREYENTWIADYGAAMADPGLRDERRYRSTRTPWSNAGALQVAKLWARHLLPLSGRLGKVLVLDLDNTLWGGVVGEDGVDGLALDDEHPGAAFRLTQQAALDMRRRGILLAVCSKNNLEDAKAVFEEHPGMLLSFEDLAAHRINWDDKASNLRAIAQELNVGVDSLVFVDDNRVERRWVRANLPEVTVIELPADPYGFAAAIRTCPLLDRVAVTAEDERRPQMYVAQRKRAELQAESASVEAFLTSLQMVLELETVNPRNLARAAQLTQRTNQLNVTTIRRSEAELASIVADPASCAFVGRLKDRFGDNGIIALVIAKTAGETLEVDTLLMSCRVIGRGVEAALLATLGRVAVHRGLARVFGRYVPTPRNRPAADLFARHGFACIGEGGDGKEFAASVDDVPAFPDYLSIAGAEDLR